MVSFRFQFYPVCNFGKFINFGLGIVRSLRAKFSHERKLNFFFEDKFVENNEKDDCNQLQNYFATSQSMWQHRLKKRCWLGELLVWLVN